MKLLVDAICHNNKGTLSYDEFLSFALNIAESDEVIETFLKMQKEIFKRSKLRFTDLLKLFSTSKTYAKGFVRNSEFQNILRKISSKISVKDVETLVLYLDVEKEGTVDFNFFAVWLFTGMLSDEVDTILPFFSTYFF